MNSAFVTFDEVKKQYTNEWILFGNPEMKNTSVIGGIVLFQSKDKKEVCYIGRDKVGNFAKVTIVYAGNFKQHRKIGILKKV